MFETLKRLYISGELSIIGLDNAVYKGWITRAQRDEILAAKQ